MQQAEGSASARTECASTAAPAASIWYACCRPLCRVGAPLVLRQLLSWFSGWEATDGDTQASRLTCRASCLCLCLVCLRYFPLIGSVHPRGSLLGHAAGAWCRRQAGCQPPSLFLPIVGSCASHIPRITRLPPPHPQPHPPTPGARFSSPQAYPVWKGWMWAAILGIFGYAYAFVHHQLFW